ncbi:hypothetical protein H0H87_006504 [Tephrocybe sp. NHM501043]|nr:hypothetical protein H0H87_006504 [Tephrocybe sp. NHM501043]
MPPPTQFTSIPFPVKALKLLLHDVQFGGESATMSAQGGAETYDVDSDDGVSTSFLNLDLLRIAMTCLLTGSGDAQDEDWTEEERQNQGFKADEFAFLSDMLGPRGMAFDNDDVLNESDDEDLKNDPVSEMDMQAHIVGFFKECAALHTEYFSAAVGQLNVEETLVIQNVLGA